VLTTTLKALKFPLKLLIQLVGSNKKRPQKTELEQKQLAHVRNFDPTRLNNRSWQIRSGKKSTKKRKKHYKKKQKIWLKVIKN
jgi:hypothetical protein